MSPYQARLYRWVFAAAALYNLAFGLWAGLLPTAFFTRFELQQPLYPAIWACLGMVIGVYGLGYAYAARFLDRAAPFIAIGLLGKILGPAGWVLTVWQGQWPVRTLTLLVFNDLIWWLPFGLFLLEGTRLAAWIARRAPELCALFNGAALLVMATLLRTGTELGGSAAERIAYIASHPVRWRGGWAVWMMAAISLVGFYAWWGSRLRRSSWAMVAIGIGAVGLGCDLYAESLLIGWLPRDFARVAPWATLWTGAAANGLYTLAGIILTVATPVLRGLGRAIVWGAWCAGASLTICSLAGFPGGMALSTAVLFVLLFPWILWFGRTLRHASSL